MLKTAALEVTLHIWLQHRHIKMAAVVTTQVISCCLLATKTTHKQQCPHQSRWPCKAERSLAQKCRDVSNGRRLRLQATVKFHTQTGVVDWQSNDSWPTVSSVVNGHKHGEMSVHPELNLVSLPRLCRPIVSLHSSASGLMFTSNNFVN